MPSPSHRSLSVAILGCALAMAGCEDDPVYVDVIGLVSARSDAYEIAAGPVEGSSFSASLSEKSNAGAAPTCTETVDACIVYTCTPSPPDPFAEPSPSPDAGPITFSAGANSFSLKPDGDGNYGAIASRTAFWNPGETLTVSAPGGEVTEFTMSVETPALVNVTAPVFLECPNQLVVSRSSDLTVSWTGGGIGSVRVVMTYELNLQPETYMIAKVVCSFPASAGQAIVPAAVVARVPPGPGALSVDSVNEATSDIDGSLITLSTSSAGRVPGWTASGCTLYE